MRLVNPEIRQPRCPDKLAAVAVAGAACEPSAPAKAPRVLTIGCCPRASSINSTARQVGHDLQQRLGPDRVLPQERFVVRENEKDGCSDAGCKDSQADG